MNGDRAFIPKKICSKNKISNFFDYQKPMGNKIFLIQYWSKKISRYIFAKLK